MEAQMLLKDPEVYPSDEVLKDTLVDTITMAKLGLRLYALRRV